MWGAIFRSHGGRFAGPHAPDTAYRKAWTVLSFRTDTLELAVVAASGLAWVLRNVSKALPVTGGVQIRQWGGSLFGVTRVSRASFGKHDDECAKVGITAIEDNTAF